MVQDTCCDLGPDDITNLLFACDPKLCDPLASPTDLLLSYLPPTDDDLPIQ